MRPLLLSLALAGIAAHAQPAQPLPAFEVASVKPSDAGPRPRALNVRYSPASLIMRGASLKAAIQWAWHVFPSQVSAPGWLDSESFDIDARPSAPVSEDQARLMLRRLLADRFQLAVHLEQKEMPAYVITVAKDGPKLKELSGDATPDMVSGRGAAQIGGSIAQMIDRMAFASVFPYPLVDQTGLKGRYDVNLDLRDMQSAAPEDQLNVLLRAVQDQVGLKIELKKTPLDVVVVDHMEKSPTAN
ncbi:MAG TPA: TIGR03435 family protein [Bryobacteraceae bacterium]|nr:TIGR03435 family protein [Bryobacteraceae bacterium]